MSRAFVSDKEDWVYCPKAGERCMHAEAGKDCTETDCEHFAKVVKNAGPSAVAAKIVRKPAQTSKQAKAAKAAKSKASKPDKDSAPARKTKKSKLEKPKKWGGRSGGFW